MTCFCQREFLTCRRILYIMVVTGFMLNASLKTVLNITIVAMTKNANETTQHVFEWSENQKQNILGVFFWGFALTKIPSGRLAEVVGSRKISGYSMVLASILTILTPVISFWNYYVLLASRVVMGFLIGASWPAIMPLAAKWIPAKENSVFLACVASSGVGIAINFHICGVLIAAFGWQSVFYVVGFANLVWCLAWFYLIYDSPDKHPRISLQEKFFLEQNIDKSVNMKKTRFHEVPWKQLAKSGPVWAIATGQVACFFAFATLCNELPSYLDQVLHLSIEETGAFAGLPYWGGYVAALVSGYVADALRKSGKLSPTNIRKLFETIALTIPSACMLTLAIWGYIAPVAITAFTISLTINAINTAGHCANILDISPNFAGTICGIVNTLSAFTVYFSTQLVAALLKNGHGFNEWRYLFWVIFSVNICANILYLILCSGEVQPWDSIKRRKHVGNGKEMQPLEEKDPV